MKKLEANDVKGISYIHLALYAFAGLGIEIIYAYLLEPMAYGVYMKDWTMGEMILHWIITCITWGIIAYKLIKLSKRKYRFDLFETILFTLILIFGQKACDIWFKKDLIPYCGIIFALNWGSAHILTKGSIMTGMIVALGGFLYGVVYLLLNRDIKKTFVILFIMFII